MRIMGAVGQDIAALAPWLEGHVAGLGAVVLISKFGEGQSNPTYLVQGEGRRVVLRAQPSGVLLRGAHRVDREFRVMQALSSTSVAVPQMIIHSDATGPLGRDFFVMDHIEGEIYIDPALPGLLPEQRVQIYQAMNTTLATLHDLDPEAVGLGDFGRRGDYFMRQLQIWGRQYQASITTAIADMERLMRWLEGHIPEADDQVVLVHGDFRLDNMIFAADTLSVAALLDWELSTLGHPFADLSYQCMQWRLPHGGVFRGLGGLDREALGLPDEAAYMAQYCARRNVSLPRHWAFYLAFNFFRMAAILQGVYRRSLEGNASNAATGRQYGEVVPLLAALGLAASRESQP